MKKQTSLFYSWLVLILNRSITIKGNKILNISERKILLLPLFSLSMSGASYEDVLHVSGLFLKVVPYKREEI